MSKKNIKKGEELFAKVVGTDKQSSPAFAINWKKVSRIAGLVLAVLAGVALLCWGMLACYRWMFSENDRLLLRRYEFSETAHYSGFQKHGKISIIDLLGHNGIMVNKTNLSTLDLKSVIAVLEHQPLLKNIKVEKVLPDALRISAEEYIPVVRLIVTDKTGRRRLFPLAKYPQEHFRPDQLSMKILPETIPLYNDQRGLHQDWDYFLRPAPFDRSVINMNIIDLFGFSHLGHELKPGDVVDDRKLSGVMHLLTMIGDTSRNDLFIIQDMTLLEDGILRVRVVPTAKCHCLASSAFIDFSYRTFSGITVDNLLKYLRNCEQLGEQDTPLYLDATGDCIFVSPVKPGKKTQPKKK